MKLNKRAFVGTVALAAALLASCGAPAEEKPVFSLDGKTVTYGIYPQTRVGSPTILAALNAMQSPGSNGYYSYQDAFYAKAVAKPCRTEYAFDDGTNIVEGTTYWFKCEPITWRVLATKDDAYYVLSEHVLDTHRFSEEYKGMKDGHYMSNYAHSEIRAWLNEEFLKSAFVQGNSAIAVTDVDNSAVTTDSPDNPYVCENTQDKVFLPSYKDYTNPAYGFPESTSSSGEKRYAKATDWARANGVSCFIDSKEYPYSGGYWSRSPFSRYADYVQSYSGYEYFQGDFAYYTYRGVRPAVTIKIS